jgi:hypothetical protein
MDFNKIDFGEFLREIIELLKFLFYLTHLTTAARRRSSVFSYVENVLKSLHQSVFLLEETVRE